MILRLGLIKLPEDVVTYLSTDQSLVHQLAKVVRSGHLPRDIALMKVAEYNAQLEDFLLVCTL